MSCPMNDTHVIARKVHACVLCGYAITPGTRHRVYSMAYDGRIFRVREHVPCTVHAEGDEDDWSLDGDYLDLVHALARFDAVVAEARAV